MAAHSQACPSEIQPSLERFKKSLADVEKTLKPILDGSVTDVQEKVLFRGTRLSVYNN